MASTTKLTLNNGYTMPVLALGTWKSEPGQVRAAVEAAIDAGYRHIDCAFCYLNENEVGDAIQKKIKEGVVKREDLFIVSKIWNHNHKAEDVQPAIEKSLKDLQIDYLDLYHIHFPVAYQSGLNPMPADAAGNIITTEVHYKETWAAMEKLVDAGLTKSIDRGSETGKLAAIHSYLRGKVGDLDDPLDSVTFGPSTSNQIERWWRELHERLEKRLKRELHYLMNNQLYNPQSKNDRDILAFIMVPVMQRELDIFRESVWNTHRIRFQRGCYLPSGIPNHIYDFPNNYNLEQCGFPILIRDIEEAEIYSGTTDAETDFLDARLRSKFESLVPCPSDIPINRIVTAYRYLKESISNF